MNADSLQLFKQLTEMAGASGFERDVRAFMKQEISKVTDEIVQDRLGSLFGVLRSKDEQAPKVMVAGHMDEVGFIVTAITPHGTIKFQPLGGWWDQVLLAQRVQVITPDGPVIGVIGSTPPHLLQDKERSQVVTIAQMYIDIGADSAEHAAELGVRQGQQIVPVCPFTPMANPKKILAKAWDNRYGVGLALELLQALHDQALPNTLFAGATVQEEVGLRGAATAAALINPDIFYALDAGPAGDMTGDRQAFGQLGKGALLRFFDRSMVTNPQLVEFIQDTALTHKIPYQFYMSPGGTDAGRVHTYGIGVPSAVIAISSRYIHTAASIIHVDDYAAAKELLIRLVQSTDRSMLDTILA